MSFPMYTRLQEATGQTSLVRLDTMSLLPLIFSTLSSHSMRLQMFE